MFKEHTPDPDSVPWFLELFKIRFAVMNLITIEWKRLVDKFNIKYSLEIAILQ